MVGLDGSSTTLAPLRRKVLTVASSPGMPATTTSPLLMLALHPGDDEVTVEDAGVDHRLAAHPEHEQLAVAGEVRRERDHLLDLLLGEHAHAGGDVADERHVAGRTPLRRGAARGVGRDLDGTGLGGIPAEVAEALQRVQVRVHRRRGGQTDCLADLTDRRRIPAVADRALDVAEDLLLALGELRLGHVGLRSGSNRCLER